MKITYVKALLYAYPHVKHLYKAYSSRITNKVHNSFNDYRPVETLADEIVGLINKRYVLADILLSVRDVVRKLDKDDIKLIKYIRPFLEYRGKDKLFSVFSNHYSCKPSSYTNIYIFLLSLQRNN